MSRKNVEKVRAILPAGGTDLKDVFGVYDGYSTGGLVSNDVVVRLEAGGVAMGGVGSDDFYKRWADWLEAWESYRLFPGELIDQGDCVEVKVRLRGVTKTDRVVIESTGGAVFCFEGERITEMTFRIDSA